MAAGLCCAPAFSRRGVHRGANGADCAEKEILPPAMMREAVFVDKLEVLALLLFDFVATEVLFRLGENNMLAQNWIIFP